MYESYRPQRDLFFDVTTFCIEANFRSSSNLDFFQDKVQDIHPETMSACLSKFELLCVAAAEHTCAVWLHKLPSTVPLLV